MRDQVVTELDAMRAVFDYLAEQLDGRFRLQFKDSTHIHLIDGLLNDLHDGDCRIDPDAMKFALSSFVGQLVITVNTCLLEGCPDDDNHAFIRELINLIWDARANTAEWLKGQGIVPGQSTN